MFLPQMFTSHCAKYGRVRVFPDLAQEGSFLTWENTGQRKLVFWYMIRSVLSAFFHKYDSFEVNWLESWQMMAKLTLKTLRCSHHKLLNYVWPFINIMHERINLDKVLKNGPNKICGRPYDHMIKDHMIKPFKGCLPQISLGPFLNTLLQLFLKFNVVFKRPLDFSQ